jgi:hypothetical protein
MPSIQKLAEDYLDAQSNVVSDNIENMPTERHLRETPAVSKAPAKAPTPPPAQAGIPTPKAPGAIQAPTPKAPKAPTASAAHVYKPAAKTSGAARYAAGYNSRKVSKQASDLSTAGYLAGYKAKQANFEVNDPSLKDSTDHMGRRTGEPGDLKDPPVKKTDKSENNATSMYVEGTPKNQVHGVVEGKQKPMFLPEALPEQKYSSDLSTNTSVRGVSTRNATGMQGFNPKNKASKEKIVGTSGNSFENVMLEMQEKEKEKVNQSPTTNTLTKKAHIMTQGYIDGYTSKTAAKLKKGDVSIPTGHPWLTLLSEGSFAEAGRTKALRDVQAPDRELPFSIEHPYVTTLGGALAGAGIGGLAGAGIGAVAGDNSDHAVIGATLGGSAGFVAGALVANKMRQNKIETISKELSEKGFSEKDINRATQEYLNGNPVWQTMRGPLVGGADAGYRRQLLNLLSKGEDHQNATTRAAVTQAAAITGAAAGAPVGLPLGMIPALGAMASNTISPAFHRNDMQNYLDKSRQKNASDDRHTGSVLEGAAVGAGAGAGLGGGASMLYDTSNGQDIDYRRAVLASILAGGLGMGAGAVYGGATSHR